MPFKSPNGYHVLAGFDKFLDKETNPKGAQLLFSTHDTNLLTIIPEKERVDTDKEKRYIEGHFGAISMLGEFKE